MSKKNIQGWLARNARKGVSGVHVGMEEVAEKLGCAPDEDSVKEALTRLYGTEKQALDVFNVVRGNEKTNKKRASKKKKTAVNSTNLSTVSTCDDTQLDNSNKGEDMEKNKTSTETENSANVVEENTNVFEDSTNATDASAKVVEDSNEPETRLAMQTATECSCESTIENATESTSESYAEPITEPETVEEFESLLNKAKAQFEATSKVVLNISNKMLSCSKMAETLRKKADRLLKEAEDLLKEKARLSKKVSELSAEKGTAEEKVAELNKQMQEYQERIEKLRVLHLSVEKVKNDIGDKDVKNMTIALSFGENLDEIAKSLNRTLENLTEFRGIVDDMPISQVKMLAIVLIVTAKYAPKKVCWHFDKNENSILPDVLKEYLGLMVELD